ncbi:DUF1672 family protein [Rossellomorea vietnamensis]|uniref:DUF1672 family protein n=1 Tax=Rossellomorea vietnamensis TaxID=218284 RepID=A0A0N8GGR2_9BACI|nr:DUF1672 family protein [Rossellomorea vietnamensis]KPL59210.1 hypothetical protein AM506_11805 [Rossellomorea vietnamensis]
MNRKNKWIIYGIGLSILLGGCMNMDNEIKNVDSKEATGPYKDTFVRVQDYTGEGYVLRNGEDADKIAEEKSDEVQKAVKDFFMEKYKIDVIVHNIVGNVDGATVFVESTGPVHFYTTAIVPISLSEEKVKADEVVSLEGEVESAIRGGLYHLIFEKEFAELDQYLDTFVKEHKVVGRTIEAVENVGGTGYMTPYYFITSSSSDKAIKPVYDSFLENPDTPVSELKAQFAEDEFSVEDLKINIELFMEEKDSEPNEELLNQIPSDLKGMTGIPKGSYSLTLNDNLINEKVDDGLKDNSLEIGFPDYIEIN